MSDRPVLRLAHIGRMGLIATSLIGSLALGGGSMALAQDASPAASPAGDCVPNAGITGGGAMAATPQASPMAMDMATPVGSPADDATAAAANAAMQNIINCAADPDALATLVTPNFVFAEGGYATIEEAQADDFFTDAPLGGAQLGRVTAYDDGTVGVNIQYMQTQYQLLSEQWILAQVDGEWKVDGVKPGDAPDVEGDTAAVGVTLQENADGTYSILPGSPSVVQTDIVVLQAINLAANMEAHELVVLQLPEGADPAGLFDGTIADADINFIGVVTVPVPGESADMTLLNLPAGQYTLVCFFPGPDGKPHAMNGMIAPFEVTAPAS